MSDLWCRNIELKCHIVVCFLWLELKFSIVLVRNVLDEFLPIPLLFYGLFLCSIQLQCIQSCNWNWHKIDALFVWYEKFNFVSKCSSNSKIFERRYVYHLKAHIWGWDIFQSYDLYKCHTLNKCPKATVTEILLTMYVHCDSPWVPVMWFPALN